jgi:hypothetical protein
MLGEFFDHWSTASIIAGDVWSAKDRPSEDGRT